MAYAWTAQFIWGYLAAHDPVSYWLVKNLSPTSPSIFKAVIAVYDLAINTLLVVPFSYLLFRLKRPGLWWGVAVFLLWQAVRRALALGWSNEGFVREALGNRDLWYIGLPLVATILFFSRKNPGKACSGI